MKTIFVYIDYGDKRSHFEELKYSLATLYDHHSMDSISVRVYTDNTEKYAHLPVTAISIEKEISSYSLNWTYHFRIKPCVIRQALKDLEDEATLVFIDTDTYFKISLSARLQEISSECVLMNKFETQAPYPGEILQDLTLPSGIRYSYDNQNSLMYNSGLVGLKSRHIDCIEDAIPIVDGMIGASFRAHTIEQCAMSESFRIHRIGIREVFREFEHYWRRTDKRFMHHHLSRLKYSEKSADGLPLQRIKHSWLRARWHKWLNPP